jgi:hypothetical protein
MNRIDIENYKKKIVFMYTKHGRSFSAIEDVFDSKTQFLKLSIYNSLLKGEITYEDVKNNPNNFEFLSNSEILKIE